MKKSELELLYIDDLVSEMLDLLEGKEYRCDFRERIRYLKATADIVPSR